MTMSAQLPTRKRPAPGTSPLTQQTPSQVLNGLDYLSGPDIANTSDQYVEWATANGTNTAPFAYPDSSAYESNVYSTNLDGLLQQGIGPAVAPSNQLVRRDTNQQLAARARTGQQHAWSDPSVSAVRPQPDWEDDDEELERQAQIAKRQAQADRKQIPPFVQKLSRYGARSTPYRRI